MALIKNEEDVKKPSDFLKIDAATNTLILKSNVYSIATHYLQSGNKSVLCVGENCLVCKDGIRQRQEFYYWVIFNKKPGLLRLPPSVFFDVNKISAAKEKDKKTISWMVLKSGTGKDTRYTTSIDDFVEFSQAEVDENNARLEKICTAIEKRLATAYDELASHKKPAEPENLEVVNPEDVPF